MSYSEKPGDREFIEKLANAQCTNGEIAGKVGCCIKTLCKHFTDLLKKGRAEGMNEMRLSQYEVGVTRKNVTMLIWLGKQYLGQCDKAEIQDNDVTVTFATQAGPPESLRKKAKKVKALARRNGKGNGSAGAVAEGESE